MWVKGWKRTKKWSFGVPASALEPGIEDRARLWLNPATNDRAHSKFNTVIPSVEDQSKKYVPKAPYPKRLIAPQKSSKYDDILEVFKHV